MTVAEPDVAAGRACHRHEQHCPRDQGFTAELCTCERDHLDALDRELERLEVTG